MLLFKSDVLQLVTWKSHFILLLYSYMSECLLKYFFYIYRVSQEECAILRESVPYVKLYRYNPEHLYPKLNGYGDNGQISLKL